ncbi:TRAP transporter small permease [Gammaproteobacteria bacterium]|nr:TRAP transporter small permease [Gammaproteobacteria bacterium]
MAAFACRTDRCFQKLTSLLAILGISALVVAIAVVVADIVWRRLGGGSFIGAVDLTQLSVMIAVSLSIPYAFSIGSHVSVDLLSQSFSARTHTALEGLAYLIGAAITALLCWLTIGRANEIWAYGDVSQDLALPLIWYWGALCLGLGLSTLVCLIRMLRLATEKSS